MGSLLSKIKADAQKAGGSKGKLFYVKDGEKKRIRFLQDMEEGWEILFHDSYELNINVPCQQVFGRECAYCDESELRTRSLYAWCVWDYDAAEVKIFMYAMNNCTPLATVAAMYETFGTLTDRDYVISRSGKQQSTQYTAIPMDKAKFRNEKAKPLSKSAFLKILDEAYPDEHANKSGKSKTNYGSEDQDYSEMSAKELYNLCEDRGIEAEPKNKQKYYIDLLKEYDENNSDNDEWEDEDGEEQEDKYSGLSAKELYKMCQERDIECKPKKPENYYINLLKDDDAAHDDWDDAMNPPEEPDDEDDDW